MFALCVEGSHTRGMGHVYRSLILAEHLRARGHSVILLMNDHVPSQTIARERGFSPVTVDVADIKNDWETTIIRQHNITLWINDRLHTTDIHAQRVKNAGITLATFDDPGTGAALADLHIAALNATGDTPAGKRLLQGVEYLILNPDIAHHQRIRTGAYSLLVTLGGSDTYGVTVRVAGILANLGKNATIIIGPAFLHEEALRTVLTPNMALKRGVPSMIEEMARHDLAITGGGITPFEANAAGLPCIIVANEYFEIPNGKLLETLGGSIFAGHHSELDDTLFMKTLDIETMSTNGIAHVPLTGVTKVGSALEALV